MGIATRAVAAFLLIGIVDYAWQKRRHSKQLKMTKQEVKEEGKQYTSPPEVRAAMRRRQMQAARARMMAAVPQADVVVTNPTHYAVALAYDGSKPAPIVVAKGKDLVALADPPDRNREQRADRARPAACAFAARLGRDGPDDPRRAVRGSRPGTRLCLPDGRP